METIITRFPEPGKMYICDNQIIIHDNPIISSPVGKKQKKYYIFVTPMEPFLVLEEYSLFNKSFIEYYTANHKIYKIIQEEKIGYIDFIINSSEGHIKPWIM